MGREKRERGRLAKMKNKIDIRKIDKLKNGLKI